MYKLAEHSITRLSDNASIPQAEGNRDYQDYLEWIAEGNTPAPEFTDAEIAANAQSLVNSDSLEYLKTTDWYVTRFTESGVAVPADVTQARTDARLAIITS